MPPTETWNVAATEHFLMSPTPHAHATLSRMLFIGSYRVQFGELATTAILLGPPWNIKSGNNIVRTWNGECTRIGSMSLLQTSLPVPALLFGTCASLSIELHFLHCTVRWAVWKAFHSVLRVLCAMNGEWCAVCTVHCAANPVLCAVSRKQWNHMQRAVCVQCKGKGWYRMTRVEQGLEGRAKVEHRLEGI